ncbi:MAG TPA: nucleotide-binding protein [Euryarchaeota archaeon]|nr:hypothetical protein BMS3Bbin16_00904 [archaeon BMS3Bbin16]HDH27880.1 nucleotide-binding protein [Euryarchaeota archaeon]
MAAHRIRDSKVKEPLKVLLDTNFLMIPSQFNVDIFSELDRLLHVSYELFVLKGVRSELETLSVKGDLKTRRAARIGLALSKDLPVLDAFGSDADDEIAVRSGKDTVVCTNDSALRKRVLSRGGKAVFLRQKRYLELEGGVLGLS